MLRALNQPGALDSGRSLRRRPSGTPPPLPHLALRPAVQRAVVDRGLPGQIPAIVGYVSRARLQQELALRSGGRLRLDPSP
jgi:hypothetical protein